MAESPVTTIETALKEADDLLRRQLAGHGLENTEHIMLAISPDGGAVIRSNCNPAALRAIALFLVEIANRVEAGNGTKPH